MSEIQVIGWLGSLAFALCAVPQAWKSFKDGHSEGLSLSFLILWFVGEIFLIVYNLKHLGADRPLMFNYIVNLASLFVIMRYKAAPRRVAPVLSLVKKGLKK